MTANDRNRFAFSYTNHDVRDKNFLYKNFNKSSSYQSNFSKSKFISSSFIGTKFKFCSFYDALFEDCMIRGTLFKKCNLQTAIFKNCIVSATIFDGVKLNETKFMNCKIIDSGNLFSSIEETNLENTKIYNSYPCITDFSNELVAKVEALRSHAYIRQSSTLHRKRSKIDTISLQVLIEEFGEPLLIEYISELPKLVVREFHTLSYIQGILRKLILDDNV